MGAFDPIRDLKSLEGKVVIITGATLCTAQQLLRKGATVYIAARNETKAKDAIARLTSEGLTPGNGTPHFHKLSLDDPRGVIASANRFLAREERLDILINNAGTFLTPYKPGAFGCENDMVVNQISPFVFTNALLPLLKRTTLEPGAEVRIVNVASDAHTTPCKVQFKSRADLSISYEGKYFASFKRYALSKLANVVWSRELARRLSLSTEDGGNKILVISLHPGGVKTEGLQVGIPAILPWPMSSLGTLLMNTFSMESAEGAYNSSFAAASPKVRLEATKYHGKYLVPGQKLTEVSKVAQDDQLGKDLWELQERILKEEGIY